MYYPIYILHTYINRFSGINLKENHWALILHYSFLPEKIDNHGGKYYLFLFDLNEATRDFTPWL